MARENFTLTETNNTAIYKETTQPKKPKRRDKSDLGANFVAPDGGWGWVVCLAAGFGNLTMYPAILQYGFIYRQRMLSLGFDAKQTTTIINFVMAVAYLVGIVNGAMFRRFTFRQVGIVGALLGFIGVFTSAFCTTFVEYLICLAVIYGVGLGLCLAATSLAVNTYFKLYRSRATGFSWTITGMGIVIFPHISTFFLKNYGGMGTILLYSGISLNALMCALTLQPVLWHVKKPEQNGRRTSVLLKASPKVEDLQYECKYCQQQKNHKRSMFSSNYFFTDDGSETPGAEITEHGAPLFALANDGWFGSKMSFTSDDGFRSIRNVVSNECLENGLTDNMDDRPSFYKPNHFNRRRADSERIASKTSLFSKLVADELPHCTCAEEKALTQKVSEKELALKQKMLQEAEAFEELERKNMKFGQKIIKFFDLDLLKDITFVNLVLGMAVMMVGEINFSILTPFILDGYGFTNSQIALVISVMGGMDIIVRFLAPFALEKVKLGNHVLFAFGLICISVGRFIVTITDSFYVLIAVFVLIGFGRGFRMLFAQLVMPSYVPLKRLPAASGLQLVCNALVSLTVGPLLGAITDATSYTVTIHFINILTAIALLFWVIESVIRKIIGEKPVASDPH